jgi:hypothetical protein
MLALHFALQVVTDIGRRFAGNRQNLRVAEERVKLLRLTQGREGCCLALFDLSYHHEYACKLSRMLFRN